MKVKPIIASMFVLGLVSGSAIAAQQRDDIAGLRARASQGAMQTSTAGGNWLTNNVSVNGQVRVDAGFSDRTRMNPVNGRLGLDGLFGGSAAAVALGGPSAVQGGQSSSDLNINNANVRFELHPGNWVNGVVELTGGSGFAASAATLNQRAIAIDEAFATIGDLTQSPFFFSAGRQYIPFGYYDDPHDLIISTTQLFSQSNQVMASLGYAQECGFRGQIYTFRGLNQTVSATRTHSYINNGGIDLGWDWGDGSGNTGINAGIGWLLNISDTPVVNTIQVLTNAGYNQRNGGIAAHLAGYVDQFDGKITYFTATQRYASAAVNPLPAALANARPAAWTVDLGYGFMAMGHENRFGVGYQQTSGAGAMGVPQRRWLADWKVNVFKSTDVEVQYTNDKDYNAASGGSATTANTGKVRLSVGFL